MAEMAPTNIDIEGLPFGEEPDGYTTATRQAQVHDPIPSRLADMEPGPVLAGFLESLDVENLSGHDLVVVLQANQRMISYHSAAMYTNMAALQTSMMTFDGYDQPFEVAAESAAAEIRAALHLTSRSADIELAFALNLHRRLPHLAEMLESGVIDTRRAKVIDRATTHLTDAHAGYVVDAIAEAAPGLTTGQLHERIARLCIDVDPDDAEKRYERSLAERRVVAESTDDGTANLLGLDLCPSKVAAIGRFIHESARRLRVSGETRTMDQLRADVYVDLLMGVLPSDASEGGHGTSSRGAVEIVCDLETLAGLADHPGDLAGYGPVIADIARKIAEQSNDAEWRFTCVNDIGVPVHTGTTSRRPTAPQLRRVEARHPRCVFPGCRMPARSCDMDHTTAVVDGGETCDCNLAPLCRRDHRIKHSPGWNYAINADASITWTTPTGHTYTVSQGRAPP